MRKILSIVVLELLAAVHLLQSLQERDRCTADNDLCSSLESCPEVHEPIKKGFRPKICSYKGSKQIVCCSTEVEQGLDFRGGWRASKSETMCLSYLEKLCSPFIHFVIGGEPVAPKELPFMALIGYGRKGDIEWLCGGSLISKDFVLSAAHCSTSGTGVPASWVKLGDLDLATDDDDAKPEILRIVERIHHPGHKDPLKYNDIALFRLHKDVKFNDYIRPICLYNHDPVGKYNKVVAAGWGNIETGKGSEKLLKVELNLYNYTDCSSFQNRDTLPDGIKSDTQLCSGGKGGGKDTCSGDSGGPLFLHSVNKLRGKCVLYRQIGITSFGSRVCGERNKPAVYTKVHGYLNWIESIVWNNTSKRPIWS